METSRVTYFRDIDFKGIELCHYVNSTHSFPSHSHDNIYALGFMESGRSYCLGKSKSDSCIVDGECAVINPCQVHSGGPDGDISITYRMFYIDMDMLKRISKDSLINKESFPEFRNISLKDDQLSGYLNSLFRLVTDPSEKKAEILEKESVLIEALGYLVDNYGFDDKKSVKIGREIKAVQRAKDLLSEDLDKKLPLSDVAKVSGLSKYHFIRVFKKNAGISPHVYRTQKRIELAKNLIKKGLPFSEIALETGFTDQSHFNKKFRQFTAASPGQYLK